MCLWSVKSCLAASPLEPKCAHEKQHMHVLSLWPLQWCSISPTVCFYIHLREWFATSVNGRCHALLQHRD